MNCPKCQEDSLHGFGQVEGVEIDFCSRCKGIWFDAGELAFYVETEQDVPDMDAALAAGRKTTLPCPRCDQHLVETHYVPGEPLLVDICPGCHGVFLDKGEVPRVEKLAVRFGGLERVARTVKALEARGYTLLGGGISR